MPKQDLGTEICVETLLSRNSHTCKHLSISFSSVVTWVKSMELFIQSRTQSYAYFFNFETEFQMGQPYTPVEYIIQSERRRAGDKTENMLELCKKYLVGLRQDREHART